jgi:hypothetical protein
LVEAVGSLDADAWARLNDIAYKLKQRELKSGGNARFVVEEL